MKNQGFPLLSPFKRYIWEEFDRRKKDFGLDYPRGELLTGLKGPRNTWIRFHSNAVVDVGSNTYQGLTMEIGKDFNSIYGDGNVGAMLGYDSQDNVLTAPDVDRYRPGPGITGVTVGYAGSFGTIRDATINWKCYTKDQLEILSYFFLNPGISCVLEFGYGNIPGNYAFDLKDIGSPSKFDDGGKRVSKGVGILGAWTDRDVIEDKVKRVNGGYDALIGIVKDYGWTTSNGIFECTTTIGTLGELMVALKQNDSQKGGNVVPVNQVAGPQSFKDYFSFYVDRIRQEDLGSDDIWRDTNLKTVTAKQADDSDLPKVQPEEQDWLFISWRHLEKLINEFMTTEVQTSGASIDIFEIDSSDILISYHPNMISTNGDVAIFPHTSAPVYKDGVLTVKRVNLSINEKTVEEDADPVTYSAKLYNIFINVEAIKRALEKQPLSSCLNHLLGELSEAGSFMWNFQLRSKVDRENVLEVADLNYTKRATNKYVGNRATDDLSSAPNTDDETIPFLFRIDKNTGFVRDFQLETSLAADQASKIVLSRLSSDNGTFSDPSTDAEAKLYMGKDGKTTFRKDRLLSKTEPEQPVGTLDEDDSPVEEYDSTKYWSVWDEPTKTYKRYAYPFPQVVQSYLYDGSPDNNINNNLLIDLKVSLTIAGIAGIRVGDVFSVDIMPTKYLNRGVFQVVDIAHQIDGSKWDTRIDGQYRVANIK